MTKPRSKGSVNPSPAQLAVRNAGRIPTLRAALAKAESRGQTDRVADLQAELDRRLGEIAGIQKALNKL